MKPVEKLRLHTCIVERTKLVRHGTFDGDKLTYDRESIETEACGTPLFTDKEETTGVCRSCASGWQAAGNVPTADGLKIIHALKA
jgi:hypothetical protein